MKFANPVHDDVKFSIRQNGIEVHDSFYIFDEIRRTIKCFLDNIVVDFSNFSEINFVLGDNAVILCGDRCDIECGSFSSIISGNDCSIKCSSDCMVDSGYHSKITTHSNCKIFSEYSSDIKCGEDCILDVGDSSLVIVKKGSFVRTIPTSRIILDDLVGSSILLDSSNQKHYNLIPHIEVELLDGGIGLNDGEMSPAEYHEFFKLYSF